MILGLTTNVYTGVVRDISLALGLPSVLAGGGLSRWVLFSLISYLHSPPYRQKRGEQFMLQVVSPDNMLMELLNSVVVSGDISTAAFIHDDRFGEETQFL